MNPYYTYTHMYVLIRLSCTWFRQSSIAFCILKRLNLMAGYSMRVDASVVPVWH